MASQFSTRSRSTTHEIQLRRNRLRRTLLETLERRELLAADLLGLYDHTTTATISSQQYAQQNANGLVFNSLSGSAGAASTTAAYDVANFLDSHLGSSTGDLTTRPWFPLVQQSYSNWSQSLGLQSTSTVSAGMIGEGESGLVAEGEAGGPRLLSVSPNSGDIFTFNNTNRLTEAPTELVFRFDGSSDLDPASLTDGIRVKRAGGDGIFGNGNDSVIEPGYLGFGDNNRIVVLRFASPLQDDLYRVELFGEDVPASGLTAIQNAAGLKLQTRAIDATPDDLTRDSVDFDLELGATIVAVVPQPVDRVGGVLTPRTNMIRVYFNNDDLYPTAVTTNTVTPNPTVVDPVFYQLIHTAETVQPSDDQVFAPTSISYDPLSDMAELTFSRPIDQLAGAGSYRLRVGSREAVVSTTNPQSVANLSPPDPAGTMQNATSLGTWSSAFSGVVNQSIITTDANVLPLDFPGSNYEPGHRDIQDETHLNGGADGSPSIAQRAFNFAFDRPYGLDAASRPVNTSITSDQVARVREIFQFYSELMGIDFVETAGSGLTIVVGDLFPLGEQSGPGGVGGIAGGSLAIMDGAEAWDNSFGGGFFGTAMHEIGHLLGLGHTYELPPGGIMGSDGALTNPNPGLPSEFFFPGDADILHGRHLYRPDNRDVDTYSFVVPAGQAGRLTAETIAERLPNSSNLDTVLTLWKQKPGGGVELISINNDSHSTDSFLSADLTEGTYFISVTGKGNEDFDPVIPNTGNGAVSQGDYQLKLDFRPTVAAGGLKFTIEDVSGTPLDGDGDGMAGGNFNFWFRAAAPLGVAAAGQPKTIFVDKSFTGSQSGVSLGSPTQPINTLDMSKWPAGLLQVGDIVRVVGSPGASTNRPAYEIGRGGVGNQVLSDGLSLEVPRGVTMMIDAGAIFKLQGSRISAGSLNASIDRSLSALQVLGTPQQTVNFTSYRDETQGKDTNPLGTTAGAGDWGGLDFHEDIDRREGFGSYEQRGIFLNYVSHADIRYGGGQITVSAPSPTVSPINMTESRPTLLNNTIRFSADAAMSADPNTFEETRFSEPRYQFAGNFRPDYARVGPDIRGNILIDNSINGMFVKTSTVAGGPLTTLDVPARWDDTDITYVLGENLVIRGTPGGALVESVAPTVSLVQLTPTSGGSLPAGAQVQYKLTSLDLNGAEGVTSAATPAVTLSPTQSAVTLAGLPKASGDFVSRRLWRSINGGAFQLVAQLDSDSTTYKDVGITLAGSLPAFTPTTINRARPDARLQIDPGIVIKSIGSRIEVGMGASLIAEGTADRPIVFTSRFDDRYGAGGTFDTNNDSAGSNPGAGDWGGLVSRPLSSMSIDHALITFGGGVTSVAGGFAGFNAVEVQQADVRLANSRLEVNGSGLGGNVGGDRNGNGPNDASVVFVVGSQPVLINNIFLDNSVNNTAVISVNANAMKTTNVTDPGRQTGTANRSPVGIGNMGPLVAGNQLLGNGLNGMRVRGETLTTETVWDDTDIVHILQSEVLVPDFHSEGGLRLQSRSDESLVVKLGTAAGLTALGRPLDITNRIGGSLQIIGAPGFPVVMTSIKDDSVGAGFDPNGRALVDTNNNGPSVGAPGDWRSVRFEPYANDRNVDSIIELETDRLQDTGTNDVVGTAQSLGALAASLNGGDENLRLGFVVDGSIASPQDLDVYSFSAVAGTQVWLDIDRTSGSLDSVVELLDANGRILAQSNNSLAESMGIENRYVATSGASPMAAESVAGLEESPFATPNTRAAGVARDFYSVNPLDAGMRILLPGATGATNTYYVRVRSSNLAPGDAPAKLQNVADERQGLTTGNYRLQVRMQQTDEVAGSTVRYADIRYATNGIEARGMVASSPLLGQVAETAASTALGNIAASDRGSVTVSGIFDNDSIDVYSFTVGRGSVQVINPNEQNSHIGMVFDVDYADGFGRPDTTLWVFDSANRLVLVGTDSNIADDQAAPGRSSNLDDLSRGSGGTRDPFIGASELPVGNYTVVVSNNSQTAVSLNQFQQANASNPLVRLEPINSVQRISQDRFENGPLRETAGSAVQVSFSNDVNENLVQWTLADMTAYVVRSDGLVLLGNAYTGAPEAYISDASNSVDITDVAMSPTGRLVAPARVSGNIVDGNTGNLLLLNSTGTLNSDQVPVGSTVAGNSGLQTYTAQQTVFGANPAYAVQQRDHAGTQGNVPQGDGFQFNGLTFATADDNQLKLFGVGSRGRDEWSFNLPTVDANGAVNGILTDGPGPNPPSVKVFNTTNVVYKLDATTGAVINPGATPQSDREGTGRVGNHAGTQKVEFGRFLSGSVDDPNGPYTSGVVTGLAQIGNNLYAVSNLGEFYRVNIGNGDSTFGANETVGTGEIRYSGTTSLTVVEDAGVPVEFTGLTRGPRNLEGGRYANMLFATTADGTLYAVNTNGVLQPIFPGYSYKVNSSDRGGLGTNVVGMDFSPLDVNLFHLTDLRDNEAGHGRPQPFDQSQNAAEPGDRALYFGFQDSTGNQRQQGNWSGVYDVAAYNRTYNLPGGAHGATVSNPIDLRAYSASDLPMLYFNYFLDTENANSDLDQDGRMRDAFRVYGAGEDGNWILLTTNNTPRDQGLNRNQHTDNNFTDELDNFVNDNFDPYGNPLLTQEAYDGSGWRQVRTSLGAFAGQENVRLRFEFSTAASFQTGDPLRGGVELIAVAGSKLQSGTGFTITPLDGVVGVSQQFEFDMGLVLSLPAGADLTSDVSTLTINGTPIVFSTTDNTGDNVQYAASDSPTTIAQKLAARLPAIFAGIVTAGGINSDPNRPNVLSISGLPEGTAADYSLSPDLHPAVLNAFPQATGAVKIPVTKQMTESQVRDAIRTSLAETYNDVDNMALDPAGALDVWKFTGNTLQLFKYDVTNNTSALGLTTERIGDTFGASGNSVSLAHMDERTQNNTGEGLYIDDIIIGFAERGEMVFSATGENSFAANRQYAKTLYDLDQPELGRYQLTVRTAADYGLSDKVTGRLGLARQYDTNDRLSQTVGIQVEPTAAGSIPDGATFTLTDGRKPVTFEFDVVSGVLGAVSNVQPGNVAIVISAQATRQEIARAIRDTINSSTVQSLLNVTASIQGEMSYGTLIGDVIPTGGTTVVLHGRVASSADGSFEFPANTFLSPVLWGQETEFGEDLGDSERARPQGQLLLVGNTITNSQQYGIDVSAGNRDQSAIAPTVGNRPYPGAPIAFPTANPSGLAPGVVIVSNIVASNVAGGIRLQGDAGSDAPAQIARVLNNTIYGVAAGDNGILIENRATPTILNNIIANTGTGVRAPAGSSAVLGANVYQSNATHTVNVGVGSFAEILAADAPLFVDVSNRRFYLAPGSRAIDSSIEALQERPALAQVKNAIGLPESPMLAPDLDVTGQRRVDDPSVSSPAGLGGNVFKDRGAVDRSDFVQLEAVILQPQDNDAALVDSDRNPTTIQLTQGTLEFFSILLQDNNGTGPNPASVVPTAVSLTENGRLLTEGVDYVFGYNANSRTVRLTPQAGIWRTDSVYEITLNNASRVNLSVGSGAELADGDSFEVTYAGGARVFEFDSDGTTNIAGAATVRFSSTMTHYEVVSQLRTALTSAGIGLNASIVGDRSLTLGGTSSVTANGSSLTAVPVRGITDLAGNLLNPNRSNSLTQFTIIMPEATLDFGDADGANIPVLKAPNASGITNGNGPRHVLLPIDVPQLTLGTLVDAEVNGQPTAAADGDDTSGVAMVALETLGSLGGIELGNAGPAVLSFPDGATVDGQSFTIIDSTVTPVASVTFEFGSGSAPDHVVIPTLVSDTPDQVAARVATAIQSVIFARGLSGLTPVAIGERVSLGGTAAQAVDLTNANSVLRLPGGNVQLVIPASLAGMADGQTLSMTDGSGASLQFELNNTDPAAPVTPVAAGRIAINVNLATATASDVAQAIATAINAQVEGRKLRLGLSTVGAATAQGVTVSVIGDDEDGVYFGGIFDAGSAEAVPVTVFSSGAGLLDAWIDWNNDGDFDDPGENLFGASQTVVAGQNIFMIDTPAVVTTGFSAARFRLSIQGGLSTSGVAIGGEVEDYLVAVLEGLPPDPVNAPPEFTIKSNLLASSYTEDQSAVTINDFIVDARPGPLTKPGELLDQTVRVHSVTSSAGAFEQLGITLDPITGKGSLTFKTNLDVNSASHDLSVVVTLKDGDEAVDPDVRFTSKTFTITVDPVNDAPDFSLAATEVDRDEDAGDIAIAGFASNIVAGPATALDETTIAATKQTVRFVRVSNSNDALFESLPSISPDGELTFRTRQDQNGQSIVVMRLMDDGSVPQRTPSDELASVVDRTFTITIAPINDAPTFNIAGPVTSREDAGPVLVPNFLIDILPGSATATDELSQQLTITATPLDPTAFTQFSISNTGTLSYQTRVDANRLNADFRVEVYFTDNGLSSPGENTNRSITKTFTIDVTPVNDAPSFALAQTRIEVVEDAQQSGLPAGATVITGFATNVLPGPPTATDEGSQGLNPFEIIGLVGQEKFSTLPAINPITGTLTFTTAPHANGLATFAVRLIDQGPDSPAPNRNASDLQTFTIAIAPINDAPEFSIPSVISVDEDAGLTRRTAFASGIRRGPVGSEDENSQLLNFVVTAVNPALFSRQPTIEVDGTLTFQTAPDVNSDNAQLLVEVTLFDDGLNAPLPNVNHSSTRTFTITVNAVNDAPISDAFGASVDEDESIVIDAGDVLLGDIPGPTADEAWQTLRMTQVQRTSLNGGTIVPVFDLVDTTQIVSFRYAPALNFNGQDTFLYVVTDDGSPERSGTGTVTVTVNPINDAPAFNRGADQSVNEDAPAVSVANWATGIVAGPASAADELASQTVSFSVVAAQPEWFAVQPAISDQGTLTYTLAQDVNGSTQVVVTAVDSGASTGANISRSAPQTFTIAVAPVNDQPVFTAGPVVTVAEDAGAYSQTWATGIAAAAGLLSTPPTATDEGGQLFQFELAVDKPQLFSVQPRISRAGLLEFTTAKDAFGTALVVATLVDNGATSGVDNPRSVPRTLTISITPSNDAPLAVDDRYSTTEDSILTVPAAGLLTNDTDVDLPDDTLLVVAGNLVSDMGANVTLNANGSVTYDPTGVLVFQQLNQGQSISDTFVYKIRDAAGALSNEATVTIAISGVNDAPVAVNDRYSVGVGQPLNLDVLTNDTDVDSTIDPRTIVITSRPGFGTATISPTGIITYTPEIGFRGNDSFRYTVKDTTGTVSNEAEVLLIVNSAPVAANDSAFTFKGNPVTINVLSNDFDGDGSLDTSSVRIEVSPSPNGSVEVLPDGVLRFTPTPGFFGEASFGYSVQDNSGTRSNVATVSVRVQNSRWQNPQNSLDVNADGFVSPIDALIVINYINAKGEPFLPNSGLVPPPYLDTTGDELVTPNDVLQVINYLNANSQGRLRGEGEASGIEYVQSVTPQQMVDTVGPSIARQLAAVRDELLEQSLDISLSTVPATIQNAPRVAGYAGQRRDEELLDLLSRAERTIESEADQSSPLAEAIDSALDQLLQESNA